MNSSWTLDMVINRALNIEEQSYKLYTGAIEKLEAPEARAFLKELADWEIEHKAKLLAIKDNPEKMAEFSRDMPKVQDLRIVNYLEDAPLTDASDYEYQKLLIYAGKREQEAFEYYDDLAKKLRGSDAGRFFARLAAEELTHKNKIEKEYDQYVLQWG
jgi:rubrerythrin